MYLEYHSIKLTYIPIKLFSKSHPIIDALFSATLQNSEFIVIMSDIVKLYLRPFP